MNKRKFRFLILISLVLTTLAAIVDISSFDSFTKEVITFRDNYSPAISSLHRYLFGGLGVLGYVLFYVAHVGLYVFWSTSRLLLLISLGMLMITTPAIGPFVKSGVHMLHNDIAALLIGAIVVSMYCPTISVYFNKESNNAPQPTQ